MAVTLLPDPTGFARLIQFIRRTKRKRKRRKRAVEWELRQRGHLGEHEELTRAGYKEWRERLGEAELDRIVKAWTARWTRMLREGASQ